MVDHRPMLEGIIDSMNAGDYSFYDRYFTEDFVDEMPQSGEVVRGRVNARWIVENYPGGSELGRSVDRSIMRSQASDEMKVVAPTYAIVKVEGRGNEGTAAFRARYPDGSLWWIVILYQLRGDRICRSTTFFAPEFPAPEWRAGHVERIPER
jgi:hypothetical protein